MKFISFLACWDFAWGVRNKKKRNRRIFHGGDLFHFATGELVKKQRFKVFPFFSIS
jgi:hypothetical protein